MKRADKRITLTEKKVRDLEIDNGKDEQVFLDSEVPGLTVRIREGGSRKYVVNYRLNGSRERYVIGDTRIHTLMDARQKARDVLKTANDGNSPKAERAKKAAAATLTFSSVADDYLAVRKQNMRPRSFIEYERHLKKYWQMLDDLPLTSVGDSVAKGLRHIAKTHGNTAANRSRSTLSAMYAWAIGERFCKENPVTGTNKAQEKAPRERVLSDADLASVWNAAPDMDYGRIIKLLMLTAQRRDEIGKLRWSEVDLEAKTITLPSTRTKNGRQHTIPLSDDASAILRAIPMRENRDPIFGDGEDGYSGWSAAKVTLDKRMGGAVGDWTLHDLRRTGATRMADSGIQPHIIEAVLNHVGGHKSGVAGIYNRSMYEPEKRQALDTLATYIRTAIAKASGANVTRLKQ